MPAAMPCKTTGREHRETCSAPGICKTNYACIVEADESTRKRMEGTLHEDHEDHIVGKGINSLNRYNLVHKFTPKLQAMETPEAKAAVDKILEKLKKIPAWQLTKVRKKKEVIAEARNEGIKVHFASLMDIWHLKNSELEPKFEKYKGREVLRGDMGKDDSGSYAVFTEQDAPSFLKIPKSECPDIWICLPRHKWPKSWSRMEDPVVPLERNLYGHALAGLLWERQFEKVLLQHGWEKNSKLGMSLRSS